jgi:probable HAF family extracellular repeat protein
MVLTAGLLALGLATVPQFEIIQIGTFGTGPCGTHDVAPNGLACGQGTAPNGLSQHAFFWDGDVMHNIQPLNAPDGGNTWGFGMNAKGQVVGYSNTGGFGFHAYRWSEAQGTVDLGVPDWATGDYSQAKDINDAGAVVGLAGTVPGNLRGCIWVDGNMLQVPTLGGDESQCNAISERGDVVGMSRLESGRMRGFVIPECDVDAMVVLDAPEGGGAWATDITESRVVCGWGADADGVYHALRWSLAEGMVFLDEPDGWQTFAYDINEDLWITGKAWAPDGTQYGCVWIDGAFYLLQDLTGDLPAGAELRIGRAINDDGWIATSLAYDDADNQAIMLRPLTSELDGDVNGDGVVNTDDILLVIGAWGPCTGCAADIDGDGFVGANDLLVVLAHWTGGR